MKNENGEIEAVALLAVLFGLYVAGGLWARVGIPVVMLGVMIIWFITRGER